MKKIKKHYHDLGIAKKIFVTLLLISIIPIIVIELIIGVMNYTVLQRKSDELIESSMVITKNSLENHFTSYEKIIMSIYTRNIFAQHLENLNNWNTLYYHQNKNSLIDELQNIIFDNPEILGIGIMTNKKEIIRYEQISLPKNKSFCFPEDDEVIKSLFLETKENPEIIYSQAIKRNYTDGSTEQVIYIAHRVVNIDKYSNGSLGSIILCVKESDIANIYKEAVGEQDLTFIFDQKGNVISASNNQFIGHNVHDKLKEENNHQITGQELSEETIFFDEEKIHLAMAELSDEKTRWGGSSKVIYKKSFLNNKFFVINVQDAGVLLFDINYLMFMIILIGIIMVLFSLLISLYFYNGTKESVDNIITGMKRARDGDLSVYIKSDQKDEFALIGSHFNDMVKEIDESNQLVKEGLNRIKNAEIKALEAQINPHFLYNTLDAINWLAIEKEQFMISKMLRDLGIILRYSIHKSNEFVTLGKELDYLKKYIQLQQMRFEYAFDYSIEIEDELRSCKIHKLLFQPLIENSIIHGFEGRKGEEIIIEIKSISHEELMIIVSDNGKGMPKKVLDELKSFDYKKSDMKTSIGLRNLFQRIKYYYGDRGSYTIDSNEDGTCITLVIPIEE